MGRYIQKRGKTTNKGRTDCKKRQEDQTGEIYQRGRHCQQRCHSKLFKLPNVRSVASLFMPMRRGLLVVKNGMWVALLAQYAIRCWTAPTCRERMGFYCKTCHSREFGPKGYGYGV